MEDPTPLMEHGYNIPLLYTIAQNHNDHLKDGHKLLELQHGTALTSLQHVAICSKARRVCSVLAIIIRMVE